MFRVSGFVFRVSCFVFRVSCFVFRVPCFVFRVSQRTPRQPPPAIAIDSYRGRDWGLGGFLPISGVWGFYKLRVWKHLSRHKVSSGYLNKYFQCDMFCNRIAKCLFSIGIYNWKNNVISFASCIFAVDKIEQISQLTVVSYKRYKSNNEYCLCTKLIERFVSNSITIDILIINLNNFIRCPK